MKVTYAAAIGDALKEEMRRDGKVLIYGEDIAQFGNIFGITRGMLEEFGPKRVRNTPITETAIIGSAIGAAETGLRPWMFPCPTTSPWSTIPSPAWTASARPSGL